MNLRKEKETRNSLAHANIVVRWGKSLQTAGNVKPRKTKAQLDKKVEASNVKVLLGCTETNAVEPETDKVLF